MNELSFDQAQKASQQFEPWTPWLERPFGPFMLSLFLGNSAKYFAKIGLPSISCPAILFQHGHFYESKQVWQEMVAQVSDYFQSHTMRDITALLEDHEHASIKRLEQLDVSDIDIFEQLSDVYDILLRSTAFIWLTHGIEAYIDERIKAEVPTYVKNNIDDFVSQASFPEKKNAYAIMEKELQNNVPVQDVAQKYGWLRCRDGFSDPFTTHDMEELKKNLSPKQELPHVVDNPPELQELFTDVRELVWFRTARTDVFYKLLFLARPILQRIANQYGYDFQDLKNISMISLLDGKPRMYDVNSTLLNTEAGYYIGSEELVKDTHEKLKKEVSGAIARPGKVQGIAKIVKVVSDLDKVEDGDILITQMTFPSFIVAMKKASAFVTDEGGITCHAAIVAREMCKPCVIGTKMATQIFQDGDLVEVDADKGIVSKILK